MILTNFLIRLRENKINLKVGDYWEKRYREGGNSGAGSYGEEAQFKSKTLNDFFREKQINKIIDFGCGDGALLKLFNISEYCGVDVSSHAISNLKKKY